MSAKLVLISDFNVSPLARYINSDESNTHYDAIETPFGQLYASLTKSYDGNSSDDCSFIWARPESISASFNAALNGQSIDEQIIKLK